MTATEIKTISGLFQDVSNHVLRLFAVSSDNTISELAKNELLVRQITGGQ